MNEHEKRIKEVENKLDKNNICGIIDYKKI